MEEQGVAGRDRAAVARILAAIGDVTAVALLAFLIVSRLFYVRFHMTREFEFDRLILVALAAGLIVWSRLARYLDARVMLAGATLMIAAGGGVVLAVAKSVDVAAAVKGAVVSAVVRAHDPSIATSDTRYGYVLRPNARDYHRTADFSVTYTVDGGGRRVTPAPGHPRATVVFAGDSFTFGTGVEDHETYSWLLGSEHWRDVKVVNAGVGGWGITQGYLAIDDLLASEPLPSAIVYQMIPDDIFRSYLRGSVTTGVRRRLEFVDGAFVMREVQPGAPAITPELVEREIRLARDLLLGMQARCAERHVPFAVLLLADRGKYPPALVYALGEHRVPLVDLAGIRYERFEHDYHPNAADHRRIADAVAASPVIAKLFLEGRAESRE
jgi:hypothetical protein